MSVVLTMIVSTVVTSLTDWLFFGVWMHERYRKYPEVWRRPQGGPGQNRAVAWSAIVCSLSSVGFVGLCAAFSITGLGDAVLAGALIWLACPVPALVTNTLFLKLDPLLLVPHGLGWLARLLVSAGIVGWLL